MTAYVIRRGDGFYFMRVSPRGVSEWASHPAFAQRFECWSTAEARAAQITDEPFCAAEPIHEGAVREAMQA